MPADAGRHKAGACADAYSSATPEPSAAAVTEDVAEAAALLGRKPDDAVAGRKPDDAVAGRPAPLDEPFWLLDDSGTLLRAAAASRSCARRRARISSTTDEPDDTPDDLPDATRAPARGVLLPSLVGELCGLEVAAARKARGLAPSKAVAGRPDGDVAEVALSRPDRLAWAYLAPAAAAMSTACASSCGMADSSAADVEPSCRARRGFVAAHARRSASTAAYASAAARLCSPSVRDATGRGEGRGDAAICP